MKKSDRLAGLMQRLKDGRLHTAEALADAFGVSVRTIYRDMGDHRCSNFANREHLAV